MEGYLGATLYISFTKYNFDKFGSDKFQSKEIDYHPYSHICVAVLDIFCSLFPHFIIYLSPFHSKLTSHIHTVLDVMTASRDYLMIYNIHPFCGSHSIYHIYIIHIYVSSTHNSLSLINTYTIFKHFNYGLGTLFLRCF